MAQPKSTYAIFCEMLRHQSAKPLVNRARNFVERFPSDLTRYDAAEKVHDFLTQTEQWMFSDIIVFEADADEQGRINGAEGLEKMVIGRLFNKLFEIDPVDAEEDAKLKKHIDGLSWVEAKHLGIPSIEPSLWPRVIQELNRMDEYKSPCDKLTCVVNACHVINDVLKRTQAEAGASRPLSADDFLPLLIFAVIKANPPRLQQNTEFVASFRHPSRLNGEHAYWITMLMSAKEFVKQAGPATLDDVSPEEFAILYAAALEEAERKTGKVSSAIDEEVKPIASTVNAEPERSIQEPADTQERSLLQQKKVLLYQVPPASSAGHRSSEWQSVIWKGPCSIAGKGEDLAIRMIDKKSGRLFAECLVPADKYDNYVESVTDSRQHFVLKITNGDQTALIGLFFADQADAEDFQGVLQDFRQASKPLEQPREQPTSSGGCAAPPSFEDNSSSLQSCPDSSSSSVNANQATASQQIGASEDDLMAFLGSTTEAPSPSQQTAQAQTTQQAYSAQCADPFSEFGDLINLPDVHHNDARIPVIA